MTGLDPARHEIVEIATLVTDDDLNIVATGPDLVISVSSEALALMEPVVAEMHTRSGLLDAIAESEVGIAAAQAATLEFLRSVSPKAKSMPLCGNSISTDRSFLAVHMPEVNAWLHYRNVDVSSVKELCRRWFPRSYNAAPAKAQGHRAMDDIRESIAELAYYRRSIFVAEDPLRRKGAQEEQSAP